MDGDAFGSLSALYLLLEKLWKEVKAVNDEPVPADFSFLWLNHQIETDLDVHSYKPDLIITLDTSSEDRLWISYEEHKDLFWNTIFVVIDHHSTKALSWDLEIIEPSYSSTCELLYEIVGEMWFKDMIDEKIATSFLMGINTDTNIYYNTNTTARTLKYASELLELGWDQRTIIFELFKKKSFNKSKLWWESLAIARSHAGWNIVGSIITQEMYRKTQTTENDSSWLINSFFANIEWADVAYLICETETWIKCSMRSKESQHNVSQVAQHFWGGGHIQAAGFFLEWEKISHIENQLIDKLLKIIIL